MSLCPTSACWTPGGIRRPRLIPHFTVVVSYVSVLYIWCDPKIPLSDILNRIVLSLCPTSACCTSGGIRKSPLLTFDTALYCRCVLRQRVIHPVGSEDPPFWRLCLFHVCSNIIWHTGWQSSFSDRSSGALCAFSFALPRFTTGRWCFLCSSSPVCGYYCVGVRFASIGQEAFYSFLLSFCRQCCPLANVHQTVLVSVVQLVATRPSYSPAPFFFFMVYR